jgi:2'-5' RNA ligase
MPRLFIGLFPDAAVRDALAGWRDACTWPRSATPVATARLHMTLHFIGEVDAARVQELSDALPTDGFPFELHLARAVLWPHGVAVIEPDLAPAALLDLHAATRVVLQRLGLPVDPRPYRPHVTLARRADGAVLAANAAPIAWTVERYALMQSTLGPGGGYTAI